MARSKIITYENPKSPTAEAYRTLRTNIQFSSIDKTIKSIVVTSFGPGEKYRYGKYCGYYGTGGKESSSHRL